ncbi:hypothetical protein Tco_0775923, partial [Tanacetum coccineum]
VNVLYCLLVVTTATRHNTAGDHKYWCFTDAKKYLKKYGRKENFILPIQVSTARVDLSTANKQQREEGDKYGKLMLPKPNQLVDIHDPNKMVDIPNDIDLVDYDEEDLEEDPEEDPEEEP